MIPNFANKLLIKLVEAVIINEGIGGSTKYLIHGHQVKPLLLKPLNFGRNRCGPKARG